MPLSLVKSPAHNQCEFFMGNYFILREGKELGPITANDIRKMAANGNVLIDDQVKKGACQWL